MNSHNLDDAISDLRLLRIHLILAMIYPFKNIKQYVESLIVGYSKILSSPFFTAHKDFTKVPLKQMEKQLTNLRLRYSKDISIQERIQIKNYFVKYFDVLENEMNKIVRARFTAASKLEFMQAK